mmetsp:Transcript_174528/g.559528  ORF Transcript_174528/g.559528 Transcript_174528/m.559528 type:complete len:310 (-) Transcript_174528:69-998(-)
MRTRRPPRRCRASPQDLGGSCTRPNMWSQGRSSICTLVTVPSEDLLGRLCFWLSYWSCWPLFYVIFELLRADLVHEDELPAADGLLLTLAVWAQVWNASRLAPQLFALCSACCGGSFKHFGKASREAVGEAVGGAWTSMVSMAVSVTEWGNNWLFLGAALVSLLVVASFFMKVMAVASALLTLMLLAGVAADSARLSSKRDGDAAPVRLAFWALAVAWLLLCRLPLLGDVLSTWTPVVLLLAAGAGHLTLSVVLLILRTATSAVISRSPASALALGLTGVTPRSAEASEELVDSDDASSSARPSLEAAE